MTKRFWLFLVFAMVLVSVAPLWAASPVVTQLYDNGHTGWNPNETQLTVANVKSSFKALFKNSTDGQTYSQPLYLSALNMGALGTHNVIFVATENNTIYAFDADAAGAPLWSKNLTPSGETLQTASDYNNTRVPTVGITGTPVIDITSGTIYAVAASKTISTPTVFHQRLHALDVTSGAERANSPTDIQAKYPGTGGIQDGHGNVVFDPLVQFNRPALLLFGNNVYTAWGSHEDNGVYQGWVIAYDKTSLAQTGVFNSAPNLAAGTGGGSIWQASIGLVADSSSVYFISGNGTFDASTGGADYGDSAVRLGSNLTVADYFTPCNQAELDSLDVDLGSGGIMILPDQITTPSELATHAGKEGSIYLLDRTAMGGYTPTTVADNVPCTDNVVQKLWRVLGTSPTNASSNRDAYWGAPAFFRDSSGNQYVYYSGSYDSIKEYNLAGAAMTPGSISGSPNRTTDTYPNGGTIPSVSSNAGDPASAVLWAIKHASSTDGYGPLTLDAYAATDLTNQLVIDIPAGSWNFHNYAFLLPTVANGKVYVASGGELDVFGINGSSTPTSTSTSSSSATPSATATPSGTIAILSPTNGATVSGTVSIVTQFQSPPVTWENIYIDGKYFASSPPSTFSWNSTTVANGSHTIRADGKNSTGVVATASITVIVANGVPTPTPTPTATSTTAATATPTATPSATIAILSPTDGATVSGTVNIVTQFQSPPVTWENIYIDGKYFASSPPSTFSWNTTAVANGSHTIRSDGKNSTGVVATASITVTVANGSTTPTPTATATSTTAATATPTATPSATIAILSPTSGATVSGTVSIVTQYQSPPVTWENIYIDGVYLASSPPSTFNWNSTTVANGQHTIRADGKNSTGVMATTSISVTVAN